MDYHKFAKAAFASGSIKDGYFGGRKDVLFTLHENGTTIAISESGCFSYHMPAATDIEEAYWLLENHPLSDVKHLKRT